MIIRKRELKNLIDRPESIIEHTKAPSTQKELFFQDVLDLTHNSYLQEYKSYAKLIESLPRQSLKDIEKITTKGVVVIDGIYTNFSGFIQLQTILAQLLKRNGTSFKFAFHDENLLINRFEFCAKIKNGNIIVETNLYNIGLLLDTNIHLQNDIVLQKLPKQKKSLSALEELRLQIIEIEKKRSYSIHKEKEIKDTFIRQCEEINPEKALQIRTIVQFFLNSFDEIYDWLHSLKSKNNSREFYSLISQIKNPPIPLTFIKKHRTFFSKFYTAIDIKDKYKKRPTFGDRLIVIYAFLINIFKAPSKGILISKDSDIAIIGKIFVETIFPQCVCSNIYETLKSNHDEESCGCGFEQSLLKDNIDPKMLLSFLSKKIYETIEIIDIKDRTKNVVQTLSVYNRHSEELINYFTSVNLFNILSGDKKLLFLISNLCILAIRLGVDMEKILQHDGLMVSAELFSQESLIISLSKNELIETLKLTQLKN